MAFKMDDEKTMRTLGELRDSLPPAAMVADGNAYIDFLAQQESVSGGGMGGSGIASREQWPCASRLPVWIRSPQPRRFHGGRLYTDDPASLHTLLP